jgi:hypothetical protein
LASCDNVTPNSRSDDLIISCHANKILKFSRQAFSVLRRWPRMSWSLERLIKGVTSQVSAMREPPVRAEPHPTRRTSQTFLNFVPFLSVPEIFVVETELMPLQKRWR